MLFMGRVGERGGGGGGAVASLMAGGSLTNKHLLPVRECPHPWNAKQSHPCHEDTHSMCIWNMNR